MQGWVGSSGQCSCLLEVVTDLDLVSFVLSVVSELDVQVRMDTLLWQVMVDLAVPDLEPKSVLLGRTLLLLPLPKRRVSLLRLIDDLCWVDLSSRRELVRLLRCVPYSV